MTPLARNTAVFATYNVLHGRVPKGPVDLDAYRRSIRAINADVIGLQEVDVRSFRSRRLDLAAEAAAASGSRFAFGSARRLWALGRYGNALLAQGMISEVQVLKLPRLRKNEPRIALLAAVRLGDQDWSVAVTHLSLDHEESAEQLGATLEALAVRPGPKVLLGDLNRQPDEVLDFVGERGWSVADTNPTFPSWGPELRLDYVVCRGVDIGPAQVVKLPSSDHCAVRVALTPSAHDTARTK